MIFLLCLRRIKRKRQLQLQRQRLSDFLYYLLKFDRRIEFLSFVIKDDRVIDYDVQDELHREIY